MTSRRGRVAVQFVTIVSGVLATGQPFFIKKVQYRALATQADELRILLEAALNSE